MLTSVVRDSTTDGLYLGGNIKVSTGWHLVIYYIGPDFIEGSDLISQ